jgi:histidinol phosphatase-like PHP family hydrolase
MAMTDHCDHSNIEFVLERIQTFCEGVGGSAHGVTIVPGCEITHVPPRLIPDLIGRARDLGAQVVLVHGESPAEPVVEGTNRAAVEGGADVVAHPGLIDEDVAAMAAEKGVSLEISARKGHSLANGHVAQLARKCGGSLSFGSDGHRGGDYPSPERARFIAQCAGLEPDEIDAIFENNARLLGVEPQGA